MNPEDLLSEITPKYGLEDVQSDAVETVSVLDLEELESLIGKAVEKRTASLRKELKSAREELTAFAAGGGDNLEAEAADAALEAEARALEAKAEAEQRAAAALSKIVQLEAQLKDLEDAAPAAGGADPAALEALETKVANAQEDTKAAEEARDAAETALDEAKGRADGLQDEVDGLKAQLEDAEAKVKDLEAKVEELEAEGGADGEPAEPVTESDLKHARRLAMAFLEDVFMDDEAKSNTAIAEGNAREVFEKDMAEAYKQYVKRVKPAVRAEKDLWEETIEECLKREW